MTTQTNKPNCSFIGCIHLLPLPGSPQWAGSMKEVEERALREAEIYTVAGVDGLIIENTFDRPYPRQSADYSTVAAMARIVGQVRRRFEGLLGIQILAGADLAALDAAIACELDFVRVEGFAFAHVADEGIIEGEAAKILRRRTYLGAGKVQIWADIKKKHSSHALTQDLSLMDVAEGAVYCGADKVVVTGRMTGAPPTVEEVEQVAQAGFPVVVGSGADEHNLAAFGRVAGAIIIGSACKTGGHWQGAVEPARVERLIAALRG